MKINLFQFGGGNFSYDAPDLEVIGLTVEQGFAASPGDKTIDDISGDMLTDDSDNWEW